MRLAGINWNGRTGGIAAAIVATTVAVTATMVAAGPDAEEDAAAQWEVAEGPVSTALHTVDLPAATPTEVVMPQRRTEKFSMVGVSWSDPKALLKGTISVRTRAAKSGTWSAWKQLTTDDPGSAEPGEVARGAARGTADPLWAGPSDGVEVRIVAASGKVTNKLPAGLRLDLIDPGEPARIRKPHAAGADRRPAERFQPVAQVRALEPTATEPAPTDPAPTDPAPTVTTTDPAPTTTAPAPTTTTTTTAPAPTDPAPTMTTTDPAPTTTAPAPTTTTTTTVPAPTTSAPTPTPTATAPANPVPAPKLLTRAQWGANEKLVTDLPQYGTEVRGFWVHHTGTSSDYACADSAAIVRSIMTNDVQVKGWNDLGYNFMVDKCGTVYEGRKGGIDKPVVGAQVLGFNTNYSSIAVIGDYQKVGVSSTVLNRVAYLAAYKLAPYKYDPMGTFTTTAGAKNGKFALGQSVTLPRIPGHRDGDLTICPGTPLYNQLPDIRARAGGIIGLALTSLTAPKAGSTYYTRRSFAANWTVSSQSELINRFEVLVDGKVAATAPGTARTVAATVPTGTHKVQVRAVHALGRTATSGALTIVGDTTAPTFSRNPEVRLQAGIVSTTGALPVVVSGTGTDNAALRYLQLINSPSGIASSGAGSWKRSTPNGTPVGWQLKALDWAGNYRYTTVDRTGQIVTESTATRTGTWSSRSSTSYLGGSALASTTKGAALKWTFTGRSFSWIVGMGPTSGQADLYVDGVKVRTLDTYLAYNSYRKAIYHQTWTASGSHTVEVRVVGTAGRPTVITDGVAVIR
ncbi:N-acetylmuramoyl-L-alanine amidase [Micromonospora siamensis]|uniref:N-acetylmuramoyl-L-alanine amidase n=1 Tax=Micromonospora siamensis TaxID=299152 RepID=A0A1C5HTE4_9ACTN|nr:N-acetylmuramoyl-L-alanine amidase [Micromonospora siamensis]SCG49187.1 N-acetylmuramoyl-L-alanine amidase [Micromonospora siamensis]